MTLPAPKERILVVLLAGIGDFVLATKALRGLRNGKPEAEIHLLTITEIEPLASLCPCVDRVWTMPIRELRKDLRKLGICFRVLMQLRRMSFTALVNLKHVASFIGALKMGLLFLTIKAPIRAGHGTLVFQRFLTHPSPADLFATHHCADAMVCISNCDKITPGMLNAAMRLNIPVVFVSGGPMEAGKTKLSENKLDLIDAMVIAGDDSASDEKVAEYERSACPTCGQPVEHFEGEVAWYCVNAACPAQLVRNVEHFVSRGAMDIVGMGTKIVEKLIETIPARSSRWRRRCVSLLRVQPLAVSP